MKTRKQLAEEIGISLYRMNMILCACGVQAHIGMYHFFLAPYETEEYEKHYQTVENGSIRREAFLTEKGEELIREVLKNGEDLGDIDDCEHITRNRWGRRIYVRDNKPYNSDPAFYDRNPGGIRYLS
ncbi:MAG: hypothetical protein E7300_00855 [Lachnospiraceae bacterium]|nr:hypothetical protein [Lachnospiraceae bacterium]